MPDSPLTNPFEDDLPMPDLQSLRAINAALDKIDHILHEMLFLSALSASSLHVDRAALQKVLDALLDEIDRIGGAI